MRSKLATLKIPVKTLGALLLLVCLGYVSLSADAALAGAATQGDQIAAFAASQANVPYCDGGGDINGPTNGGVVEPGCGPGVRGYDCMSLVQYAVYQATGIALPNYGAQPSGVGVFLAPQATIAEDTADLLPGDAVFWGGSGINGFAHSGIYAGGGNVWDAIGVNQPVQLHTMTYLRSVYSYDGAMRFWGTGAASGGLVAPVVGMASTPNGNGYWLTDASGGVAAYGSAVNDGSMAGHHVVAPIAHIVSTPDGGGYWLVAADGGIFSFGDAPFYGSMGGRRLDAPVVGMAPTPDGGGYWLVAADGGIFSFGDAPFYGSMGGRRLNSPVVGMSADDATGGYWEVASDGGIFSFGAPFLGSTGGMHLSRPVNGMTALANGQGYWFVASDGGVFSEGSAPYHGSMGGKSLNAPVVGMAAADSTGGYWLVASDGGVFSFGAPFYGVG
ncbi:MAG TPA: NlpC/P60 family protein [Acidimicrobiales bacterium]